MNFDYRCTVNIEGKAHAGNATQNIHPPLMQKTRIHIQPHTMHHSSTSYKYTRDIHKANVKIGVPPWHGQ